MTIDLSMPELMELIQNRDEAALKEMLKNVPSVDIAEVMKELDDETAFFLFQLVQQDKAAEVFSYSSSSIRNYFLVHFSNQQIREIFAGMSPDDRTSVIEELPESIISRVKESVNPGDLKEAQEILRYPENSVGRLMTPKYVRIKSDWTIARSLDHIRDWGSRAETINVIYVVDQNERLIDDLKLEQIILNSPDQLISAIMDRSFIALNAMDDQEEAVKQLSKYDRVALPVINQKGVLVGIITVDDVLDVAEEETTEDMQLMAGMGALDTRYSETSILNMIKKRIGWLLVLFVGQILTATALSVFENVLASAVILSLFIPMILSSGGNSGSQAATLIIRALSTDDIRRKEWLGILKREIISGLILGGILGLSGFVIITSWAYFREVDLNMIWWLSALSVSFSLVCVVLFGNLLGSMMPFLMSKFGLDPAVTSGPFVSTISDVTGILIYFSIAMTILKGVVF